jgi:protein-S-isoprenylcysteine O-methyltransferase Ste14
MSVLEDHTLVTTGPYRFVRHPSYLAIAPILVGMTLAQMTRGSWLTESGAMDTYTGKILVCLWQLWGWYCWYQTLARAPIEDEYLRKRFGQQWTDWKIKVPYRVLPGIF